MGLGKEAPGKGTWVAAHRVVRDARGHLLE